MNTTPWNWKVAVIPLTAFTVALSAGIAYFAGSSGENGAPSDGVSSDVKFESSPHYAPGSRAARGQAYEGDSSIDLLRKVNANFSQETAPAVKKTGRAVQKPKTRQELEEFMKQVRRDINYDPAAQAGQASTGAEGGQSGSQKTTSAMTRAQGGQAEAAAVHAKQSSAGGTSRASTLASRKSNFSTGRLNGSAVSAGNGGLRQQRGIGSSYGSSATGSSSQDTDRAFVSGAGARSLEAGSYGSHGGGGAAAAQGSGASSPEAGGTSGGGGTEEAKQPPGPIAVIWPRSFDFGNMYMYETAARQVIVMNIGDAALKLGKVSNMDDGTPFYLEKDKCSGMTLSPGKSCTFRLRFSPRAVKEYLTGFEVPSNDGSGMVYQSFIEVKGASKYSYSTWWWYNHGGGTGGYNNRVDFGLVPAGYSMDQLVRITNTSGSEWNNIKLDKSKLPASFKFSSDACSGRDLGPQQSCSVTLVFAPTDASNGKFSDGHYGQYRAVNINTGAKLYNSRPKFPPLVIEEPVEVSPAGSLRVLASYNKYINTGKTVLEIPVQAKSSAKYPVEGLVRVQHYYYFR